MKTTPFTPEESIQLIDSIIKKAKNRFEENGFAFILWGAVIAICSFTQSYLIHLNKASISWYPYLIMPLVAAFVFFYSNKKKRSSTSNPIASFYGILWLIVGINIMIIAFEFSPYLKENLVPLILLLLGIATLLSGSFIKSRILSFCGLILNCSAFVAFLIPWKDQSTFMGILAIVAFLIPGIVMKLKSTKQNV
jgi:hypothetical protein